MNNSKSFAGATIICIHNSTITNFSFIKCSVCGRYNNPISKHILIGGYAHELNKLPQEYEVGHGITCIHEHSDPNALDKCARCSICNKRGRIFTFSYSLDKF